MIKRHWSFTFLAFTSAFLLAGAPGQAWGHDDDDRHRHRRHCEYDDDDHHHRHRGHRHDDDDHDRDRHRHRHRDRDRGHRHDDLSAWAGEPGHGGRVDHGDFFDEMFDRTLDFLEVTPEQRQELLAIKDRLVARFHAELEAWKAQRPERARQAADFWRSNNPDADQLRALVDQKVELFRSFGYTLADAALEMHQVLTPAQRDDLARLIEVHATIDGDHATDGAWQAVSAPPAEAP